MSEEIKETIKRSYNLKNLYLDPNNYRFVDNRDYKIVSDIDLLADKIQKRTKNFIEGNKRENIKDLISSFKANGFIDVDVIQVRDLGNNNYLVLEGNRRITTLKAMQEDYEEGKDIGNLNPEIFKKVPFEIHENEEKEKHLIIMGLKHISGNKPWSAINQAQLMYDYLSPYWGSEEYFERETKLCDSIGISKVRLRTSQRAYHLIRTYKKSDYGDQFVSDMYYSFVEIVKNTKIKEWIDWDDYQYEAKNFNRLSRLFSWLSKDEVVLENHEEEEDEITKIREPIINTYREIKELSLIIDNEYALSEMEKYESVSMGLIASGEIEKKQYESLLNDLEKNVIKLRNIKDMVSLDDFEKFNEIKNIFSEILPVKSSLDISKGNFSISFEHNSIKHFETINVNKYKVFENFKIEKLNKINIFAGLNNSGKSSLLEAIYYLTMQNDIVAFLEIIKLRNKLKSLDPVWLNTVFDENDVIDVDGLFDGFNTSIKFRKFEAKNIDKKDDYLASYEIKSVINDRELDNTIHTFKFDTLKRENERVEHLCNSILKSPYFYNLKEVIETYSKNTIYKNSDGRTAIKLVIEFIKEIDDSIGDIRLNEIEDIERFIVDSSKFNDKNLEITNYGEGLQRIFEIALSFAYARNGVVCIDEFETAIHYSLLIKFTKFIQELSDIFNVQVFLTSHSKECIDAFVNNNYRNNEISAYHLENINGEIKTKYVSGERLKYLVENISLDIRSSQNG